jgi:hypothetical protein
MDHCLPLFTQTSGMFQDRASSVGRTVEFGLDLVAAEVHRAEVTL